MTCQQDDDEVSARDAVIKDKQKLYADNHRHTRLHDLRHGYLVIAKQAKRNKFTLPYDPVPYKVVNTKGSMVTAEKITGDKLLTRNSSHFKKVVVKAEDVNVHTPVIDDDPENDEPDEEVVIEVEPPDNVVAEDVPNRVIEQRTRSGRAVKTPVWLDAYVH